MHAGEFLLSEAAGTISREAINVAAGPALEPGRSSVWSATGEFAPYKPTAEDGSENAIAILYGRSANRMWCVVVVPWCVWPKSAKPTSRPGPCCREGARHPLPDRPLRRSLLSIPPSAGFFVSGEYHGRYRHF
jgi:hypothetical protein